MAQSSQASASYYEYCERCQAETPHRFLGRQRLTWTYQCKRCGQRKTCEWKGPTR